MDVKCNLQIESVIKTRIEQDLEEKTGYLKPVWLPQRRLTIGAVRWVVDRSKGSKSKWLLLIDIKNANWDKI